MKEKTFFKWSFGLRFLFVFLCALMCVGNVIVGGSTAKAANYANIKLYCNNGSYGGVNKYTSAQTSISKLYYDKISESATLNAGYSTSKFDANFIYETTNPFYYAYAKAESGCEFVEWDIYYYNSNNQKTTVTSTEIGYSTSTSGVYQVLQINKVKGSASITNYFVRAVFQSSTKNIKCDQPSTGTGSYTVDTNNDGTPEITTITSNTSFDYTPGTSIRLAATPDEGYYFYRWYYRAGNNTRVDLTPTSTSTTNNVTTSVVTIPAAATAIGADFRRKKAFQVASYSADFTSTDYSIKANFNNTSRSNINASLSPTATGTTSFELYEGETVTLKLDYATPTTRGVHFNAWCYAVGTDVTVLEHDFEYDNPIYVLDYNTLNAISGTPIFGVNVEKKATRNITFLVNPNGSYHASFMDANGNGTEHTNTSNSAGTFKVAKNAANDITESLYEDDKIRLERTNSGDGNDVSSLEDGKLFRCWYWEDANGNKTYLEKGETYSYYHVDNRLDIVLPEEATRVGADIVTPDVRDITFVSNEHGSYSVKADKYDGTLSTVTPTIAANSSNVVVNNLLMQGAITLKTPVAATGYAFSRWYYTTSNGIKKTLASQSEEITVLLPEGTTTVGADFVQVGDFSVSGLYFTTLTDAIQAAQSEVKNGAETSTIIVARDATVPAGNYTIPAKVVLLIPYKAEQYTSGPVDRIETTAVPDEDHAYRKLTLANGAHLEVYGTIEVSGCQTTAQQRDVEISRPGGSGASYGLMQMNSGSSITLNDKSQLNAWGFIQGTGTIDARRGSSVREQFQINDWKTLITTCRMAAGSSINYQLHVLPINQYFIQNVEVKTTYHPGSRLFGQVSANVIGMKLAFNDVGIIGVRYSDKEKADALEQQHILLEDDVAVFLMDNADNSEDTWVCKWYDVENDQQVYDVNNSAYLGSLAMEINFAANGINIDLSAFGYGDIEGIDVDSRDFALPLTNNFKIHLKSGNLVVTQNTILLPGAVIEIDKKSTMTIAEDTVWNATLNNNAGGWEYKPQTLYLYDANQWGKYVTTGVDDDEEFTTIFDAFNNYDLLFGYGSRVKFRPGGVPNVRDISSTAGLGDAQLIVHGTVDVKGYLKTTYGDKKSTHISSTSYDTTTPSETDGGAIISTVADAGTIIFSKQAQSLAQANVEKRDNFLWQVDKAKTDDYVRYVGSHVIPAWLKNEAGSTYSAGDGYTETANAEAGKSFCFIDIDGDNKGEWVSLTNDGCFVKDDYDTYYAKPKEYVALANGKTANADHTYSDAAGQGRLFILVDDCQWWEVEKKDNLYHCINPDNDTYYYWDNSSQDEAKHKWREKEFAITWVNWNGDALGEEESHIVYPLHYGITPKYLEDKNPTRPDDVDYTYNFIGWTPEIVPVTGNATYTAVYEAIQKKYTIIFNDQNGEEIERQQLALGETPSAPVISSIANSYWNPAIAVVSGNATYQVATTPLAKYTVTWANYNGTPIYSEEVNTNGEQVPAYNKATAIGHTGVDAEGTPVKNLNNEYNYTWTGWQSPAETYDKDVELPAVSANITYTATFSATAKGFDINFYEVDGVTPIDGAAQHLAYGATPVAPEYTNPSPEAGYTYSLQWIDMYDPSIAGVNVPTVTRAANYQADFIATINKYTVTLLSGTDTACTFVGAGLYDYNAADDALTIRVNPNVGYKFVKWQVFDGDEYVDTDKARSFTTAITADMTYRAIVEPQTDLVVDVTDVTDVKKPQEVDNLILSSNGSESGQLLHSDRLTVAGNVYFDLAINAVNHTWYGFAVPWQVDAENGISVNGRTLELGVDFDIIYYDGARRASEGKQKCWSYVENDGDKTLQPGRLYMLALMGDAPVIRFAKKEGAVLLTTSTEVEAHPSEVTTDANWNGVANPALFHAYVNAGSPAGQVYNPATKGYMPITMSDAKMVVGQGAFIQTPTTTTVTVTYGGAYAAPRRNRTSEMLDLRIAPMNKQYTDRLFLQMDEDKEEDTYIIAQDLVKVGVSSQVAQMWVNRYNAQLCMNTIAPTDGKAEYPLGISVPTTGEYTISLMPNEENTVYLTRDGQAIWNLSDGAYTMTLNDGKYTNYGIRVGANAPQVTTGIDEAVVDAKGETRKVLIDNQVFIIRGEKVYTIDGQLVK